MPFLQKFIISVVFLGLVVGVVYLQNREFDQSIKEEDLTQTVLQKAPDVSFTDLDGEAIALKSFLDQDQKIIVHFWGTWCAPCEAELPELYAFISEIEKSQKNIYLLVAVDDEVSKIKKRVKQMPELNARVIWLLDNKKTHRSRFGSTKVPETFVFLSNGKVAKRFIGPQEWNKSFFYSYFAHLK